MCASQHAHRIRSVICRHSLGSLYRRWIAREHQVAHDGIPNVSTKSGIFFTIRGRIISATNTINHVFVVFFGLFNGYDKMKTIGDSQNEIRAVKKCYIPLTIFYKIVMCLSTQKCVKTVA